MRLYEKVKVEEIVKKTLLTSTPIKRKDPYGGEYDDCDIKEIKIDPTPYIKVTYYSPKEPWMGENDFESIEFPYEEIDKRIVHYRQKIKTITEKIEKIS